MTNISKTLIIPKINIKDINNEQEIKDALKLGVEHTIGIINWDEYPSKPKASFKIAHNGTHLFLHYFVEENEILANVKEDNGEVWTDSCVEFFLALPQSNKYYNAEFTCIGKGLLGNRETREDAKHAPQSVMQIIERYPSLGQECFDKKQGNFQWDILLIIPTEALWMDKIESFNGIQAKGNFYKCGDKLTTPHFLSWNPIETEKPNFHQPLFFGELIFED